MWLLTGPFDGKFGQDASFQKSKLLKTNKSYTLGRKEQPLVIASKKISKDHCDIVVGEYTIDDVGNLSTKPSLHILNRNTKDKPIDIKRGSKVVKAQLLTTQDLEDGDVVSLISGIAFTVQWKPVCVYSLRKSSVSLEACASLGIKLIYKPHAEVTHHLTDNYNADLSIATSLLSLCQLVQPEWLNEFIRLGTASSLNGEAAPLEAHFDFPSISKFRPIFSPLLPESQKHVNKWEPNEERVNLFHKFRFICMTEKIREKDGELRDAIHRGGGTLENFDIHSDISKFHQALTRSRAKEGKSVVVIGDIDAIQTAVGSDVWDSLLAEAKSFGLNIFPTDALVQAILDVDTHIFSESIPMDVEKEIDTLSSLPDDVPNTLPEESLIEPIMIEPIMELSQIPKPPRRLTRRVMSQPPADVEPSVVPQSPEAIPYSFLEPPTPVRSSRLKRRVGVAAMDTQSGSESQAFSIGIEDTIAEPPVKKFKALFDASNPERESLSSTQTESQIRSSRTLWSGNEGPVLSMLREEEEEESQMGGVDSNPTPPRVLKRRLESVDENSEEMDVVEREAPGNAFSAKKRAIENVNAVERSEGAPKPPSIRAASKPPSSSVIPAKKDKQGAAPGKPDTDAAFLKAIASTKRGKKAEDNFDREFNNLKISKPELEQQHEPEEEWAVLADFGDDTGLRGNFMVVVELDVYKKDKEPQSSVMNHSWAGKTNFKKFKKKVVDLQQRPRIELFPSNENIYGMGSSHRKGDKPQSRSENRHDYSESQMDLQITQPKARKKVTKPLSESDDDDGPAPPTRASRDKPQPQKRIAGRAEKGTKKTPLFIDSDDEENHDPTGNGVDEEQTLQSSFDTGQTVGRRSTRTRKPPVMIVDDDSDDDAVFKGFKGQRKGR